MKTVKVRPRRVSRSRHHRRKKVKRAMKSKDQRWTTGLFLVLVTVLVINFLSHFTSSQAVTDSSILLAAPHAVTLQYLLLTASLGLFTYLCLHWFRNKLSTKWDKKIFLFGWAGLAIYYFLAFQPLLAPNGDNAEYIINAKSLIEHGRALRLDTPNDTPNTLASLGLPSLLAPIYAIWGLDIIKMKALVMVLGLFVYPVFYLFLKDHFGSKLSLLITLVAFTSPYVLGSSTTIMTESPYLLLSLLGLVVCSRYHQADDFSWKQGVLSLLMLAIVFQMRIVGLALAGALATALLVSAIKEYFFGQSRPTVGEYIKAPILKKLLLISIPAVVGLVILQIWQGNAGTSQAEVFFGTNLLQNAWHKANSVYMLIGPMLFSSETFRWISFAAGAQPPNLDIVWFLVAIPAWVGLGRCIYQNLMVGYYTLFCIFLIVFGSRAAEEMVIIRYLTILVPLIIFFYVVGVQFLLKHLWPTDYRKHIGKWPKVAVALLLAQMLLSNASSNAYTIARGQIGYGTRYEDMIETAEWAGKYLPEDALVASVKPRIFYLYSERDGMRLLNAGGRSVEKDSDEIVRRWFDAGATHIVLDQLSGSSRNIATPIVESSPHLFEKIASPSANGSATIYKLRVDSEL